MLRILYHVWRVPHTGEIDTSRHLFRRTFLFPDLTAVHHRSQGRGVALGALVGAISFGSAVPHLIAAAGGVDYRVVVWSTSGLTLIGGLLFLGGFKTGME